MVSDEYIRKELTVPNYNKWLRNSFYSRYTEKTDDWDPKTATCGAHAAFVVEQLGFKPKDFRKSTVLETHTIGKVLALLDKGYLVDFIHNYADKATFSNLPKDNRYGNHQFQIIKGDKHYFITQGFLHAYKHSLVQYTREEIQEILQNILTELSDYENKKRWKDINDELYKEYFCTELFMYPKRPVKMDRLVHNIIVTYDYYTK
jgi:hypothetical protein